MSDEFEDVRVDLDLTLDDFSVIAKSYFKHESTKHLFNSFYETQKGSEVPMEAIFEMLGNCVLNDYVNDACVEMINRAEDSECAE
ncbi:MAG: hypothetical protein ACO2ZZ_13615 [Cyclobacteriaceae bacterium]